MCQIFSLLALLSACACLTSCGQHRVADIEYGPLVVSNAYLFITHANGQPASGTTFHPGDELTYEGGFDIEDDRTTEDIYVNVGLHGLRSDSSRVLMHSQRVDTITRVVARSFTYAGTVKVPDREGELLFACDCYGVDGKTSLGTKLLTIR